MSRGRESTPSAGVIIAIGIGLLIVVFVALGGGGNDQSAASRREEVSALHDVHGLAVDLEDPNRPFIASHTGLFTLEDGKFYRVGSTQHDLMGFAAHPTEGGTFFSSGHPKGGGNLGFQASKDGGLSWQKVSDGLNGPVDFHALAVSQANPQIIYGWFHNELQKSVDGGKKWQPVRTNLSGVFAFVSHPKDEQTLFAVTNGGVLVSQDGGQKWSEPRGQRLIGLAVDPSNGQNLIASSSNGLLKSNNSGEAWSEITDSPGSIVYLAYARSKPSVIFAVDQNGSVYQSTDSGTTWITR